MTYLARFADSEPMELADLGQAQTWMWETVKDMKEQGRLPGWRALALRQHIEDMPRAGLSFHVPGVGIVKVELRKGSSR